ncbi:hypothetical protein GCK72_002617 [Caenorhabditis remanei]|uniref:Uncharacterized protein n=1 Tax=Caenorhabditis remanei TaxID=31234 RepID=A0A6A5HVP4_CAERE|nr:hypothetical protein GCK72_002617 [Caenorhabditis remanei]KAF1770794.1 hypothetical protein GCK72_002617 [Caenorhabditis remanei]
MMSSAKSSYPQNPQQEYRNIGEMLAILNVSKQVIPPEHVQILTPEVPYLIKLTSFSSDKNIEKIELLEYNKSLGDALKYLIHKLIGKRKQVLIEEMEIHPTGCFRYRLPIQVMVRNLKTSQQVAKTLDAFLPVIDARSLRTLEI